ncbi:MAG: hypothetical protein QXY84_02935 [Candidatus Caldarchaeum sp.]
MPKPANPEEYERIRALKNILDSAVTGPRKGGLSVYGTAVLVNVVN